MNGNREMTRGFVTGLRAVLDTVGRSPCDVVICPPAHLIGIMADLADGSSIAIGGQDCHVEESGAHTGDIAAEMLADAGAELVIVGHSERRTDHNETSDLVRNKAAAAHRAGLTAIVCLGETESERDSGAALSVVEEQLAVSVPHSCDATNTVVAYEPVWAIGTGRTPTLDDVAEIHAQLRRQLSERFPSGPAVRLLYGGSVKPNNAAKLLAIDNVDGALVGGASLDLRDFLAIIDSCP